MSNYTIELLTQEWIRNTLITFLLIPSVILIGKYNSSNKNIFLLKCVSIILLIVTISGHILDINNNNWTISEHLPLHLCAMNQLICCFILFIPKKQFLFEFLFYGGGIGGIQAILTPQINYYDGSYFMYFKYYLAHSLIIIFPLFLYFNLGFKLTKNSWLRVFLAVNILMVLIMPLDFLIDANYMYLAEPPEIDNPLVIGKWPYYLINLEFIVVTLFLLTYLLFKSKIKVAKI